MTTTGSVMRLKATRASSTQPSLRSRRCLSTRSPTGGVTSRFRIGDLADARLHVPAAGDDVWVALATQAADGRFVEERLCDVLFGVVFDAARAEVVEPRADRPGTQARERNPLRAGAFAPVTAAVSTA